MVGRVDSGDGDEVEPLVMSFASFSWPRSFLSLWVSTGWGGRSTTGDGICSDVPRLFMLGRVSPPRRVAAGSCCEDDDGRDRAFGSFG